MTLRFLLDTSIVYEPIEPTFQILPYDEVAAAWPADERARLERAGTSAPFPG